MTCIVGLVQDGKIYMGGDSAASRSGGYDASVRADAKVFRNGAFLMGFTTSFRMGQLLRYKFCPPERPAESDVYHYMVCEFVDAVRACLKAGGFAKREHEEETGGKFMVGYAGRLFVICDDYQVAEMADRYAAVGCGEDMALGALHATQWDIALLPEVKVRMALDAACHFSSGVRGPFTILVSE